MKHALYEVWKEHEGEWKVQLPKGLYTFTTRRKAEAFAAALRKTDHASEQLDTTSREGSTFQPLTRAYVRNLTPLWIESGVRYYGYL